MSSLCDPRTEEQALAMLPREGDLPGLQAERRNLSVRMPCSGRAVHAVPGSSWQDEGGESIAAFDRRSADA